EHLAVEAYGLLVFVGRDFHRDVAARRELHTHGGLPVLNDVAHGCNIAPCPAIASFMNLNLLRIFVAVAEAGSFSRAADGLGISQPAVSKAVRELESQLDTVLLERKGRSFTP